MSREDAWWLDRCPVSFFLAERTFLRMAAEYKITNNVVCGSRPVAMVHGWS